MGASMFAVSEKSAALEGVDNSTQIAIQFALVAQWIRALPSEGKGSQFDPGRAHQSLERWQIGMQLIVYQC